MALRRLAAERRAEIADAALRVLATQGPGRFTAAAVAAEVGVSDAAVFRHYATMDEVVLGAIERAGAILFEGFPPDATDPIDRIGQFFRHRISAVTSHPGVARMILSDDLTLLAPAQGVARVAEFKRQSLGFVRKCLAEASAQGLLEEDLSSQAAVLLITGSLMALAQASIAGADRRKVEGALGEQVWATLERVLRGRSPRESREPPG